MPECDEVARTCCFYILQPLVECSLGLIEDVIDVEIDLHDVRELHTDEQHTHMTECCKAMSETTNAIPASPHTHTCLHLEEVKS